MNKIKKNFVRAQQKNKFIDKLYTKRLQNKVMDKKI